MCLHYFYDPWKIYAYATMGDQKVSFKANKNVKVERGFLSHKQLFSLFENPSYVIHSQHISAQIGHYQVVCEKYTNDDGIL